MAGIQSDGIGYRKIIIKPEIVDAGINELRAEYRSINGWIRSSWKKKEGSIHQSVAIPVNTQATVYIPANRVEDVSVNGKALKDTELYAGVTQWEGHVVVRVGSGRYWFATAR